MLDPPTDDAPIRDAIKRVMGGADLNNAEMAEVVGTIMDGCCTPAQVAGFLVALRLKGETVDEITGAAQAMRARMTRVSVQRRPLIDTCGTGGDGAGTFNISTAVAFVAAAGGAAVAKHGNRAVSSRSGSADVLAALGINLQTPVEVVHRCIEEIGLGFLFAPAHHPAMQYATPVRRELGIRTVFNLLGPLTNPAGAPRQLMGVFSRDLTSPIAAVLGRLGAEHAWVVHGADGLDELTICDATFVAEWTGSAVVERIVKPEDVGIERANPESLAGGTPQENALILRELLAGERDGPLRDAVALNTGAALLIADLVPDLPAGVHRARKLMEDGAALKILDALVERTQTKIY